MRKVSIIIPVFNEEKNIKPLINALEKAINKIRSCSFEVLLINDGSTDRSEEEIKKQITTNYKLVNFTRNFGQTAAISAGFDNASGDIVIAMDSDLQNDPEDISLLLSKIDEGYDVVSGWRRKRKDNYIRVLPSQIANKLISWISGVNLHDYGCTLKAYKKEFTKEFKLYGEMHRFIPIYAFWQGAKVTEVPVNHFPRKYGNSKYGMNRIFKVILDLITIKFLGNYATKPSYFFGSISALFNILGLLAIGLTLYEKIFLKIFVHRNPMFLVAIFLFLTGTQFLFFGILAELMVRTYYESSDKKIYRIKN